MNAGVLSNAPNDVATDVVIIGAGLSGLCCALELSKRGLSWTIVEASDRVGGRVATDTVEGFLLDRGFQVLLDAYPETRRILDYNALDLRRFHAGAAIWLGNGAFATVSNPLRHPRETLATLMAPVGNLRDKISILRLRRRVTQGTLEALLQRPECTTLQTLQSYGFSEEIIERFFRPFLGGIFLDRSLATSSRMFEFVFRMFSLGSATVPARGMEAIPAQIASMLAFQQPQPDTSTIQSAAAHSSANNTLRLHSVAQTVQTTSTGASVVLTTGERIAAKAVVVATDWHTAQKLTSGAIPDVANCSTACLYFATTTPPSSPLLRKPLLLLNGSGKGFINNMCSPSAVAPETAPAGNTLISVSTVELPTISDEALMDEIRKELRAWFGSETASWRHLWTYRIERALPNQAPPALAYVEKPVKLSDTLFVCGDHRNTASIHGAMMSGRRAAEALAATLMPN
jgi:phytoene dehydrogenase-like protein